MKAFFGTMKKYALPIAMVAGISSYLIFHWTPAIHCIGPAVHKAATTIQPILIFIMLFLQFNKISPHDLKLRWWHVILLCIQGGLFIGLAAIAAKAGSYEAKMLIETAMLCFITPTAAAAGVITEKLGGNLSQTMTYVILSNCLVAVLVPSVIPHLHPIDGRTFIGSMLLILRRVFPILILPCLTAWLVRYTMRKLQIFLMRYAGMAFYIWSVSLAISLALTTRSFVLSHMAAYNAIFIALISFVCCILQFWAGHRIGGHWDPTASATAGQSLGQKNTVFQIWLGYTFMTPETSIGGGFYSIWHNMVNSWELMKREKNK